MSLSAPIRSPFFERKIIAPSEPTSASKDENDNGLAAVVALVAPSRERAQHNDHSASVAAESSHSICTHRTDPSGQRLSTLDWSGRVEPVPSSIVKMESAGTAPWGNGTPHERGCLASLRAARRHVSRTGPDKLSLCAIFTIRAFERSGRESRRQHTCRGLPGSLLRPRQ